MAKPFFLVEGSHWDIPGVNRYAHESREGATVAAVRLVEMLRNDSPAKLPKATAENWESVLEKLQDRHGAQYCFVTIYEMELEP